MSEKTLRERIETVEKEMQGLHAHPMLDAVLKSVVLPQLKSLPERELKNVQQSVREIVKVLKDAFDV